MRLLALECGDGQHRLRLLELYEPISVVASLGPVRPPLPLPERPWVMDDVIQAPEDREDRYWPENWTAESTFWLAEGPFLGENYPRRAGYISVEGITFPMWSTRSSSWTVKTFGEWPKGPGGAFYYDHHTKRPFTLSPDDVWRIQGLPLEMLSTWRVLYAHYRDADPYNIPVPSPTDEEVWRAAGNAIPKGMARTIAADVIGERLAAVLAAERDGELTRGTAVDTPMPESGTAYARPSTDWRSGKRVKAVATTEVAFDGGAVVVAVGEPYWIDARGGVLVGAGGTLDPPRDEHGAALVTTARAGRGPTRKAQPRARLPVWRAGGTGQTVDFSETAARDGTGSWNHACGRERGTQQPQADADDTSAECSGDGAGLTTARPCSTNALRVVAEGARRSRALANGTRAVDRRAV